MSSRASLRLAAPTLIAVLGLLFLLGIAGMGVAGCSAGPSAPSKPEVIQSLEKEPWGDPDRVVAEINGRPLSRGDFYRRILERFGTAKLLAGIIKEELFLQEAERRKIAVTPADLDAKVDEIFAGMARDAGGEVELSRIYEREGIRLAELRRDLAREVGAQVLIGKVTMAMRQVNEEVLRKYYQETYARVRYKTRHIAYSFVPQPGQSPGDANRRKLEAFNKAVRAADRVRKGADFATIARAESEDSVTAAQGGDLGYIHADSPMDVNMKRAILELQEGSISDPVENPNGGYHVFQVTEIVPSQSFVDCQEKMRREILEREPELKEIEAALSTLRERSDVRVYVMPALPSSGNEGSSRAERADGPGRGPDSPAGAPNQPAAGAPNQPAAGVPNQPAGSSQPDRVPGGGTEGS